MATIEEAPSLDEEKLMRFVFRAVDEVRAAETPFNLGFEARP